MIHFGSTIDSVIGFLMGTGRFIVLLGILIFVHELGHFVAAKFNNVYVIRFSFGWGKRLFGFKKGETDYCISAIPIGGYVKMVGQEDMPRTEEEAAEIEPDVPRDLPPERRFNTKPIGSRMVISFAGPFMNFVFAFPVLWLVFMVGIQVPIFMKNTWIGTVYKGSPAEVGGLKPGQRILSINGNPVDKFEQVQLASLTNENNPLDMEVEDLSGNIKRVTVVPTREEGSSRASIGVEPLVASSIEVVFPDTPAEKAGLKKGDIILAHNGAPPGNENLNGFVNTINESAGKQITISVLRDNKVHQVTLVPKEVTIIKGVAFDRNTVTYTDRVIKDDEEAPADEPALQEGDVVLAVDGRPLTGTDFENYLAGFAYKGNGQEIELTIERPQGFFEKPLTLNKIVSLTRTGRIGVSFSPVVLEKFGPGEAFVKSFGAFGDAVALTIKTLYFLVSGRVSTREMAGPIGIAVMTEKSLELGVGYYLNLVAIITINLAIINLLPIPMLDGGMILLMLVEAIRRKPLEERYHIMLQKIGVAFVLFIILMATYNDVLRAIRLYFGGEFIE